MKRVLAPVVLVSLGMLTPAGAQAAIKARSCGPIIDPTPSRLYAAGVPCTTALRIANHGLGKIQVQSRWTHRLSGRRWRCATRGGTVIFRCTAGGRRVEVREP